MNKLIYVMDPLCGWCYGNSANMLAIKDQFAGQFEFELLMGGMWVPPHTRMGGDDLSKFMEDHAPPMEQTTGATVSKAYYELAKNTNYEFSSLPGSAASVLVKELKPEVVFEFASSVQKRFYQEGMPLDQFNTYQPILINLGIDEKRFEEEWMTEQNLKNAQAEFNTARSLAQGYPTLLIELDGQLGKIASGYFPLDAMQNHLKQFV